MTKSAKMPLESANLDSGASENLDEIGFDWKKVQADTFKIRIAQHAADEFTIRSQLRETKNITQRDSEWIDYVSKSAETRIPVNITKFLFERPSRRFHAIQEYEGVVKDVDEKAEELTASLVDISKGDELASVLATIPLEEISPSDRCRVRPGAVFRLSVGYERDGGTQARRSQIYFRNLPAWRDDELKQADERAHDWHSKLQWDDSNTERSGRGSD